MKQNIISIAGMQGGAGRTTICMNLGYTLSEKRKKKVLLIDFNPNQGMTDAIFRSNELIKVDQSSNILLSLEFDPIQNVKAFRKLTENLFIIPASHLLYKRSTDQVPINLTNNLKKLEKGENAEKSELIPNFDFILIDSPSQLSPITGLTLMASDGYLFVGSPDFYLKPSFDKFLKYQKQIEDESKKKHSCYGIILNQIPRTNSSHEIIKLMDNDYPDLLISEGMRKKEEINAHITQKKNNGFFAKSTSKDIKDYNDYLEKVISHIFDCIKKPNE